MSKNKTGRHLSDHMARNQARYDADWTDEYRAGIEKRANQEWKLIDKVKKARKTKDIEAGMDRLREMEK
ncbi:MAG: hypothetical protein ABJN38_10790 [Lentilitoribacter sp.]